MVIHQTRQKERLVSIGKIDLENRMKMWQKPYFNNI